VLVEKRKLHLIKRACKPLSKNPIVRGIWIFGSATRKKRPGDIDLLVLIDTSVNNAEVLMQVLQDRVNIIQKQNTLNLHIQKFMDVSKVLYLIFQGEPWILTSFRKTVVIYDPFNYTKLITSMAKKTAKQGSEVRSERLISRAQDKLFENRNLIMGLINELFLAIFEAIQLFFVIKGKAVYDPKKAFTDIQAHVPADIYFEIMEMRKKVLKGTLSELTGKELDYYYQRSKSFIELLKKICLEEIHGEPKKDL